MTDPTSPQHLDPQHFDVAIIGTGSGNSIPDERYADMSVAIFEEGVFGGTCLNVGCIPTKMYVYAAEVARTIRDAAKYGIDARIDAVRWNDIVDRVFGRIDPIAANGEQYRREGSNTTVFAEHVTFVGDRTLETASGARITADQIVIAAGSRAIVPEQIAASGVPFHTSDDVMRLPELPKHLVIVGGGFIAAEFAHVFSAFGSTVSIVCRGDALLRRLDHDISAQFNTLARKKWDVHTGTTVTTVRGDATRVTVELSDGTTIEGDALLVATGRQANGDRLGAAAGGFDLDDDGRVVVDEFQRTTATGVFALGDVSSPYQLKHVANHEQRVVTENLLRDAWASTDDLERTDHRFVPAAVFTDPQIADVGLTEHEARDAGYDVSVKIQSYGDVAYGWAMEDDEGLCKIVAERGTGKILGAHIIGVHAPTLIQPLIQAMTTDLDAHRMARGQYWIHPALPEVVENALLGLE
ncbi:mycothione reductase [Antrihabitans cavernicola]|uniref:Mycothione reductase n=1 Tax=Antrihabitans cavernicola TaxID=2495913 RepID=A0A5A7SC04_9NOCA|nr:mycothione reductase [Spelaeibacter cavernicola]KAA0023670.1 mycothione reductase [Spelaeibacter cavernicola]